MDVEFCFLWSFGWKKYLTSFSFCLLFVFLLLFCLFVLPNFCLILAPKICYHGNSLILAAVPPLAIFSEVCGDPSYKGVLSVTVDEISGRRPQLFPLYVIYIYKQLPVNRFNQHPNPKNLTCSGKKSTWKMVCVCEEGGCGAGRGETDYLFL